MGKLHSLSVHKKLMWNRKVVKSRRKPFLGGVSGFGEVTRIAKAAEARLLDVPARSALLVERRVIVDVEDRPLEHTESRYVADRYVIDAVFTLGGTAPSTT